MRDTRRSSKEKRVRRGGEGVKEGREGKAGKGGEDWSVLSCQVVRDDIDYLFGYSFACTPSGAKEIYRYEGEDLSVEEGGVTQKMEKVRGRGRGRAIL